MTVGRRIIGAPPFTRYWNEWFGRQSDRSHKKDRFGYSCPGHIGHMRQIRKRMGGKIAAMEMFEHWHWRSQAAYRLYWRTHPEFKA